MAEELSSRVIPRQVEDEVRSSYLTYAMSVIVSRALPDARDGLKPVHRRLLHAMNEMGLRADRPYRKTARVVGEVLGKFHPHGEQAVYDALVRMAQDFSLRYPVIDGQGNFGSIDGDPPAAQRYTEARLAPIAQEMLADIGKETVDFQPNYDDHLEEPVVLPGAFPFLMANGASGIAVGMATNMPPHNLREVARAVASYIDNPKVTVDELMRSITGPDFPTGGIIYGRDAIAEAYRTGRGRIPLRGRLGFETLKSGREAIVVTEIPYQVNKATMVVRIADLHRNRRIEGIADLRDESDRRGMRVVIELKRGANRDVVVNQLFAHTQLQITMSVNALALVKGQPRVLDLKSQIELYVDHRREVVTRRARFDLRKAEERLHILEGLKLALDHIDEVIRIIRGSRGTTEARIGLRERFELSRKQTDAILDMRLQRLTSLEVEKVEAEIVQVGELIQSLRELLGDRGKILAVVKRELADIARKYGDDRRTEVVATPITDIDLEDLIPEEDVVVQITNRGIVKRLPVAAFRRQSRGGKGSSVAVAGNDFVRHLFISSTHSYILFVTDTGKSYWVRVHELPDRTRSAIGQDLRSLLGMTEDEQVTAVASLTEFDRDTYLFMATARGVVKKVRTTDFTNARTRGIVAINLDPDDRLVAAMLTDGSGDVVLATRLGYALRFSEYAIRSMGRATRGVAGIRLRPDDAVVGAVVVDHHQRMFVISRNGYGKRMAYSSFTAHGRGTMGQIGYKIHDKTGPVAGITSTHDDDDVVCITERGKILKATSSEVPVQGRSSSGVRVVRIEPKHPVAGIARAAQEDDPEGPIFSIGSPEE